VRDYRLSKLVNNALPSHLAKPVGRQSMTHMDWGAPEPFNELTLRRHLESERTKKRVLRYDAQGRLVGGGNRL
jgi:hypothetical protein